MSNSTETTPWIIAAFTTVTTALSTVVAFLFKLRENENSTRLKEHKEEIEGLKEVLTVVKKENDECKKDREELRIECAQIKTTLEFVSNKVASMDANGTEFSHRHNLSSHPGNRQA